MPMPHQTYMQLIKRRLVGKEGTERVRELRTILRELPGYRNGPYGGIRKWVQEQIDATHVRNRTVQHDSIAIRREGVAQVAQNIHKSFGSTFRHARIWGPSARFAGQQVGHNHPLADGDIVEIIA